MKTIRNGFIALMALAAAYSCANKEKAQQKEECMSDMCDSVTSVTSLRDYTLKDTMRVNGHIYHYTCSLEHVDSMPTLINAQGAEYKESRVCVSVKHDSTNIFQRTYYKKDFKKMVPKELFNVATLVGVNYNYLKSNDHSALHFIITVGDPDETSDLSFPLELTVSPDGSSTIKKAENIETGPISSNLNVEPDI